MFQDGQGYMPADLLLLLLLGPHWLGAAAKRYCW
jgi:hypothetical protein